MVDAEVLVVGAGLSGLVAARTLRDAGRTVVIVDKGRSVGGRLATRRIGEATVDHGAQFFTVRGDDLRAVVDDALAAGVVYEWCRGFGTPDGYPRYAAHGGMNAFAKWLARDLEVQTGAHLSHVRVDSGVVVARDDQGTTWSAGQAILTPPIPQSLALLDTGDASLPSSVDASLRAVEYHHTLALLVVVEGGTEVDEPGGMQLSDGPFTFIAENHRKGVSAVPALTFHAEHDYSRRRYDDDPDDVRRELLELAAPWIGAATVVAAQLKKWRYAGPVVPLADAAVVAEVEGATIVFAGDAFAGPKVEGAFNSGLAAGRALTR